MFDTEDQAMRAAQRKARRQAKREQQLREKVIGALLAHREGRDFLWWLLGIGKIGPNPFTANALTTSFNCGELNVGQQIQAAIIEASPAGYVQLIKERAEDDDRARTSADAESDPDTEPEPDA